jgi:hypothetical protein
MRVLGLGHERRLASDDKNELLLPGREAVGQLRHLAARRGETLGPVSLQSGRNLKRPSLAMETTPFDESGAVRRQPPRRVMVNPSR